MKIRTVSIPFKRESVSELDISVEDKERKPDKFQFPSNGKAYLNRKQYIWH